MSNKKQSFSEAISAWVKNHLEENKSPISFLELSEDSESFKNKIKSQFSFQEIKTTTSLLRIKLEIKDSEGNNLNETNYNLNEFLINNVSKIDSANFNLIENSIWLGSFFDNFQKLRNESLAKVWFALEEMKNKYSKYLDNYKIIIPNQVLTANLKSKTYNELNEWKQEGFSLGEIEKKLKKDIKEAYKLKQL